MARLIDADALYNSFGASGNCNNCPLDAYKCQYYNEHTLMEFCERIEDAPTVDAVAVVRCKDCKRYRHDDVFHRWYCSIGMTKRATSKDDYCSWGERRGEWQEPEEPKINPCRGCDDYDGQGGCKSNGGCGAKIDEVTE